MLVFQVINAARLRRDEQNVPVSVAVPVEHVPGRMVVGERVTVDKLDGGELGPECRAHRCEGKEEGENFALEIHI